MSRIRKNRLDRYWAEQILSNNYFLRMQKTLGFFGKAFFIKERF